MKYSKFLMRLSCRVICLITIIFSSKWILDVKANEFELNNDLITTAFNNGLIDSVKFENGKYKLFLSDEDIKAMKFSKQDLSSSNMKLLNRISFQDVPGASKEYILENINSVIYHEYIGDQIHYFKINLDIVNSNIKVDVSNEMEFKVIDKFTEAELKSIDKIIRKNKRSIF